MSRRQRSRARSLPPFNRIRRSGWIRSHVQLNMLERVVIARDHLLITIAGSPDGEGVSQKIKTAWSIKAKDAATVVEGNDGPESAQNESLIQSIVRAHGWMRSLQDGDYQSIEQLAEANSLHPKVVRQALRLAFLSPDVTSAILEGRQSNGLSLARIPKLLPLSWAEHRPLLS